MDFSFKFELKYCKEVEELLYQVDTFSLQLPDHSVQTKQGHKVCLLCCGNVLTDEPSLENHFSSKEHNEKSSKHAFDAYHRTFLDLPETEQIIQQDFVPKSINEVHCEICNEAVLLSNVTQHIHKMNKKILESLQLKEDKFKKIFHKVGRALICLICGSIDEETIQVHLERNDHKMIPENWSELQHFHEKWFMTQNSSIYNYRVWTIPEKNSVICILCKKVSGFKDMVKHFKNFPCRFLPEDDILIEDPVTWKIKKKEFFKEYLSFPLTYDKSVMDILYPEAVMKELSKFHEFPIYVIQRHLADTKCLICQQVFTDLNLMEDIIEHVKSEVHVNNSQIKQNLLSLKNYHTFWMTQEPNHHLDQYNFMPTLKLHKQKCIHCQKPIKLKNIVKHFESGCDMNKKDKVNEDSDGVFKEIEGLMDIFSALNIADSKQTEDDPIFIQITEQIMFCTYCRIFVSEDAKTHILNHNHEKNIHLPRVPLEKFKPLLKVLMEDLKIANSFSFKTVKKAKCKSCDANVAFADCVKHFEKCSSQSNGSLSHTSPTKVNAEKRDLNSKPSVSEEFNHNNIIFDGTITKMYGKKIITKIYPMFVSKQQLLKNEEFKDWFLQKRRTGRFEYFCFYCSVFVVGSVKIHSSGRKHMKSYNERFKQEAIITYHLYWLTQSPQIQLNQIKFNPFTKEYVQCTVCNKFITFSELGNHFCEDEEAIIKEKVSEKYRNVNVEYVELVMRKLYTKTILNDSKKMYNINMPISRHWKGGMFCLICDHKMVRDLAQLEHHFFTKHAYIPEEKLEMLVEYHKFWEKQSPEDQIFQVQFLLHDLERVKCTNNHIIPYEEIFNHLETCQFKDFEILLKISKDILLSKSTETFNKQFSVKDSNLSDLESTVHTSSVVGEILTPFCSEDEDVVIEQAKENKKRSKRKRYRTKPKNMLKNEILFLNISNNDSVHNIVKNLNTHISFLDDPKNQKNLLDFLPNRMMGHLKYITIHTDCLHCISCSEVINKTASDLKHHISSRKHLTTSQIKKFIGYRYYCHICVKNFMNETSWQSHLDTVEHTTAFKEIGEVRKTTIWEYECTSCKLVIYGDSIALGRHLKTSGTNVGFSKNKGLTLPASVQEIFSSKANCDQALKAFLRESEQCTKDKNVKICIDAIINSMKQIYPDSIGYPFGSRVTGLGGKNCDLDIYVDIGSTYFGSKLGQEIFRRAKKIFLEDTKNYASIHAIDNARTPIVELVHIPTNIDCDISFSNGLSIENSKYVNFCFDIQPVARPAMILLKNWHKQVKNQFITSYGLCMMFIFQLQLQEYALPVHKLRLLTTEDVKAINGWHTINYNKPNEELKKHVRVYNKEPYYLAKEFFNIYSNFDFKTELVCPLMGKSVLISKFLFDEKTGCALPDEMKTYKDSLINFDPENQFRAVTAMCVQDPFDLSHNLTKSVKEEEVNKFQELCKLTLNAMT